MVGRPQLDKELAKRESGRLTGPGQLVGLDMTPVIEEDQLEDAAAERRQVLGGDRKPAAAIAVAKPVDREMPNDGHEPGRERGPVFRLIRVGADPSQPVGAQGLAHLREDVHHIVVVLGVVPDGSEDETSVATDKLIPRGVQVAAVQLGHPIVHSRP